MGHVTTFGLLTSNSMSSKAHAEQLLRLFERLGGGFSVARCGKTEPLHACDFAGAVAEWENSRGSGFHWKTSRHNGEGAYFEGVSRQSRDTVCLSFEREGFDPAALLPVLTTSAEVFKADFAYVHNSFDEEIQERQYYGAHVMPFEQGLMAPALARGLPGIAWAMYFANDYLGAANREKLLRAPVHDLRVLESGLLLQVSERLATYERDYAAYRAAREPLAAFLNAEMSALMPRPLSGPV
jgi:hypothetical protein